MELRNDTGHALAASKTLSFRLDQVVVLYQVSVMTCRTCYTVVGCTNHTRYLVQRSSLTLIGPQPRFGDKVLRI